MGLFRSKEEKQALKALELNTRFIKQYLSTFTLLADELRQISDAGQAIKNPSVLDGLHTLNDAYVLISQIGIDPSKKEAAAALLEAATQGRVEAGEIKTSVNEHRIAVLDAGKVYMTALNDNTGMAVPALQLLRSIKSLDELSISTEQATLRLPGIEEQVISSYRQFWTQYL